MRTCTRLNNRDAVVYSATCPKLGGASVVLKVYDKARISAVKTRSVRREARIMRFITEARCVVRRGGGGGGGGRVVFGFGETERARLDDAAGC